jgi:ribose transport system permease protein
MSFARALAKQPPALPILVGLWIVVVIGLVALNPNAVAISTVTTILQFSTLLALVALGQSLVVLCGGAGIDLSVGGATSLSAILAMLALKAGMPAALAPVACLGIGAALGALNGFLVTKLRILPLIATLGTYYVYSGLAVALTNGAAQNGVPAWLIPWGRGAVAGAPLPFLSLALPAFIVAWAALGYTSWGRWIYALGHNERSARLVGIDVDRMRRAAYVFSGLLAGAAGLVSLAWLGSGRPNIGDNLELTSLTAAMLGGISIFGGRGNVAAVLAAVVLLVTLQTALLQLNVNTIWQVGVIGALLIATLLADRLSARWR